MANKTNVNAAKGPQALALHIGLNEVSAAHYAGWSGPLAACEFDAHDMAAISSAQGMKSSLLITKKATRANFLAAVRKAAKALSAGDLFFMTFSGHGGQVPDVSGEEPDKLDETWCLFDGQLIDDELYYELSRFKAGVRILVLSDSCHSGTVVRAARPAPGTPEQRPRIMPRSVALRVYGEHKAFYDQLQNDVAKAAGGKVTDPDTALGNVTVSERLTAIVKDFHPAVILISGCQDNQFSMDGDHNGAFTEQLLSVWNNGSFKGSYASLHARVRAGLPPTQSPNLFTLGPAAAFLKQAPFSL
ncbi:caspase family protein [Hydrogenophaga sp. PBL-H3]|uniref:caspase family protein n=1 Tax=Hydrogenophaga sp. PBL-H3 TaxID=434010 RepID=UPI0013201C63|nr:caspase family protein [Hydrogenophaga sp. PBL-H3]QHE76225.1 caspase family protein [Hydrogenophaga sp. PBL-H3]QHE80649.1 caspase family protein [Hydrogenophaga sp. PBL-H3]